MPFTASSIALYIQSAEGQQSYASLRHLPGPGWTCTAPGSGHSSPSNSMYHQEVLDQSDGYQVAAPAHPQQSVSFEVFKPKLLIQQIQA